MWKEAFHYKIFLKDKTIFHKPMTITGKTALQVFLGRVKSTVYDLNIEFILTNL